ncbi:MAG: class I SAM-dependent methyltransferase [Saprospirales bacterium]|nr:class I SAM-dependent methyltransferase [Saprospirales bacterium]MBK8920720.1 class I SAM-dependent methyltransferase [Saprospirales bacterium]
MARATVHAAGGKLPAGKFIAAEHADTPTARKVRAFYEKITYHPNPPSQPLADRIAALERDWNNWVVPVGLRGKRTLDVGCGCGYNLALHAGLASVAVGLDVSLPSLERAVDYCSSEGVLEHAFFVHGDISCLDLPAGSFDLITCVGVLHHIPGHQAALKNMVRLLDRGGYLLLGVYHPSGRFWHRVKRKLVWLFSGRSERRMTRLARFVFQTRKEAEKYNIPEDIYVKDSYTAPVEKAFSVAYIQRLLGACGLTLLQVRPSPAIPFRKPVDLLASLRIDGQSGAHLLPDAAIADAELGRMRRHHYWCLLRKGLPRPETV